MPALLTTTWRSPNVSIGGVDHALGALEVGDVVAVGDRLAAGAVDLVDHLLRRRGVARRSRRTAPPRSLTTTLAPWRARLTGRARGRCLGPLRSRWPPGHPQPRHARRRYAPIRTSFQPIRASAQSSTRCRRRTTRIGLGRSLVGDAQGRRARRRRRTGRGRRRDAARRAPGATVVRRRQGDVPPRQVLRRRADDARPARARATSASTRRRCADWQVVDGAVLRSPSGREVARPAAGGAGTYAAVAPRLQLDAALVDLAVKAGATVARGPRLRRRHRPTATTSSSRLDGHGPVARPLRRRRRRHVEPGPQGARPRRSPGYLGEWHAFRQYVARRRPARRADQLYVWFDADLLPGYAWSFPLPDGRANVGFGILRDGDPPRPGHEGSVGRRCSTGPTSRAALGPGADARGPPHGLADPGPHRPGRARRRAASLFVGDAADGHRRADRRGHRPGPAHRAGWPPRRSSPAGALRPGGAAPDATERVGAPPPRRRPPDVGRRSAGCSPAARGADGAIGDPRPRGRLGPAQLRPLDVRGRARAIAAHAPPLAPPLPRPPRRLRRHSGRGMARGPDEPRPRAPSPTTSTEVWADDDRADAERLHHDPQRVRRRSTPTGQAQRPHGARPSSSIRGLVRGAGPIAGLTVDVQRLAGPHAADRLRGPGRPTRPSPTAPCCSTATSTSSRR